jgi:hypothetical protein
MHPSLLWVLLSAMMVRHRRIAGSWKLRRAQTAASRVEPSFSGLPSPSWSCSKSSSKQLNSGRNNGEADLLHKPDVGESSSKQLRKKQWRTRSPSHALMWANQAPNNSGKSNGRSRTPSQARMWANQAPNNSGKSNGEPDLLQKPDVSSKQLEKKLGKSSSKQLPTSLITRTIYIFDEPRCIQQISG